MYLFVYGTLKKGQRNHHWLGDAKFIGKGVVNNFSLYCNGSFPYAVPNTGDDLIGEIYEIDSLNETDILEGYPRHYNRSQVTAHVYDKDFNHACHERAWIYHTNPGFNTKPYEYIPSGNWKGPKHG